jgi:hypothetical protein
MFLSLYKEKNTMRKIVFGILVLALFVTAVTGFTTPAKASLISDIVDNSAGDKGPDYSAEIIGKWRVSEGHEWHERFSGGEVIEFFADGTGHKSLNDRDITDFVWSAGVRIETNYNTDEPFEEEMIILSMVFNDFELRYFLLDKDGSILWDSKLVLDQGAGAPLVLVRH